MTSKRTITQSLPQIISTEDDELNLKPNNLLFNYAFGFQNDQRLFPKILIKQFFATATPNGGNEARTICFGFAFTLLASETEIFECTNKFPSHCLL